MASKASADDLDSVTCAVCKEVYKDPVKISCKHTFCADCVDEAWKKTRNNPTCPICRKEVDGEKKMDLAMLTDMSKKSTTCTKCNKIIIFTQYRQHQITCVENVRPSRRSERLFRDEDIKPNIYTFVCPYCKSKNHDREGLLAHVKEQHQGDKTQVVCPICKAMPWGNPGQCSQNFPDHLNIRHQFDYDRFVDFNQDEDTALENTIALSTRQY